METRHNCDCNPLIQQNSTPDRLLKLDGQAYYDARDGKHDGEFSWTAKVDTNPIIAHDDFYGNDSCEVKILSKDATLLVEDNNRCGGLNVTFSGTYLREHGGR